MPLRARALAVLGLRLALEGRARELHASFVAHFGLRPSDVPLLRVRPIARLWTKWAVEAFEEVDT